MTELLQNFHDLDSRQRNVPREQVDWALIDRRQNIYCLRANFVWSAVLAASTGSMLFGLNTAVLNTVGDQIASEFHWCGDDERETDCARGKLFKTLASTAVFLGAAISASICGSAIARYGLRASTLSVMLFFVIGIIGSCCANSFSYLLFARLTVGLGVGAVSGLAPSYIAEMTPASSRGRFGVLHQIVVVGTQLLTMILGLCFIAIPDHKSTASAGWTLPSRNKLWWRVMLAVPLVPTGLSLLYYGVVLRCETPSYYAVRGDLADAELVLKRINGGGDVARELGGLVKERREPGAKTGALWKRRSLGVGVGVALFQQFTGINAFITNSNSLFKEAGLSSETATYASIGVTAANVLATVVPLMVLDRVGRRPLLLWGAVGMALSTLPATVVYWIEWQRAESSHLALVLALAGAAGFMVAFAVSVGPLTWIYIFEIFPIEVKDRAAGICVTANWLGAVLMVFLAGVMPTKVAYSVFTASSLLFVAFVYFFVRETKGRALGDTPYAS